MAFRRLHQAFKHLRNSAGTTTSPSTSPRHAARRLRRRASCAVPGLGMYGVEYLERRTLLTVVSGGGVDILGNPIEGDIFEYRQTLPGGDDAIIRVRLRGNITAELIGATIERNNNNIRLGNLGGELNGLPVFGGIEEQEGTRGFDPIGLVNITDPSTGFPVPTDINALAAAPDGTLYAFNQSFGGGTQLVQLTVPASGNGIVTGVVISNLPGVGIVTGADINPFDGTLSFVGRQGQTTRLFTVDPGVANPATPADEVAGTLQSPPQAIVNANEADPQTGQAPRVGSIAFVNGVLIGVLHDAPDQANGAEGDSQLIIINQVTGARFGATDITIGDGGQANAGTITGFDTDASGRLVAVTTSPPAGQDGERDPATVLQLTTGAGGPTGEALNLGALDALDLTSLTFVPGLTDPFTGRTGAFVGYDTGINQLVFINGVDRNPGQFLYNVYVTDSDASGEIIIAYVRDADDDTPPIPNTMLLFGGDSLEFSLPTPDGPTPFAPANDAGAAVVGAVTLDLPDTDPNEEGVGYPGQPVPSDVVFERLPSNVSSLAPGLIVERGNDIGRFILGGTITGEVDVRGNMGMFYAGFVATGDPNGQTPDDNGGPEIPDNFNVDGDLRDLITANALGFSGTFDENGAPRGVNGFDLRVGGTLGQVRVLGGAQFRATAEVNHLEQEDLAQIDVGPFLVNQQEYEFHPNPDGDNADTLDQFEFGQIGAGAIFYNDTFATPQVLGSIGSSELGRSEIIRVEGDLQGLTNPDVPADSDIADYYGVALMAGQTVRARVESTAQFDLDGDGVADALPGLVNLGVFDPDGRLIATDYDNNRRGIGSSGGRLVSFTADRPGLYRFAAAAFGSTTFSLLEPSFTIADYRITIFGVGDIGLGGIVSDGSVLTQPGSGPTTAGISLLRGDLGTIYQVQDTPGNTIAGSDLLVVGATPEIDFEAFGGNIRSIDGHSIGNEDVRTSGLFGAPIVNVPEGGLGHVRVRGSGETNLIGVGAPPPDNTRINVSAERPIAPALYFNIGNTRRIGGDVQMIDGAEVTLQVDIITNGSIGVIKAGDFYGNTPSILEINASNTSATGETIDLIESEGAFGGLGQGGPQITTNENGNVRYIRVTRGEVYSDVAFGGGQPQETIHPIGTDAVFTDDSGATFRLHVLGEVVPNPAFVPGDPNSTISEFLGSQLRTTTYGIRGTSSGVVLINVNVNDVDTGVGEHLGAGLEVVSSGGRSVEIGRIEVEGFGTNVVTGRNRLAGENNTDNVFGAEAVPGDNVARPSLALGTTGFDDGVPAEPLDVIIRGTTRVDVLNVIASAPDGSQALGPARFIENTTPDGEIVNIAARSIGVLRADGSLGRGRNHTGADIIGIDFVNVGGALLPADEQGRQFITTGAPPVAASTTNAIVAGNGNIGAIRSNRDIGNVFADGSIGELTANADGQDDPSRFEGIVGVISVDSFGTGSPNGAGRVLRTRIGEGIADAGTGEFSRAGIFAFYKIGPITGRNADIRGDVHTTQAAAVPAIGGDQVGVDPGPIDSGQDLDGDGQPDDTAADPDVALADSVEVTSLLDRPAVAIDSITLTDGSLINADVFVSTNRLDALELARGVRTLTDTIDPIRTTNFNLGPVTTIGNGGIIGTVFVAADIARITVRDGGFGIFTSDIDVLGDGVIQGIDAAGYGIRDVLINGGAEVGSLVARGDGTSLSTNAINERVRFSEQANPDPAVGIIDPFFGFNPNPQTDIHAYLGTNRLDPTTFQPVVTPELAGRTDTGVIEAVDARGSRDLGSVSAYQIRAGNAALTFDPNFVQGEAGEDDTATETRVTAIDAFARRRTRFQFANSIGTITTRDVINGLTIISGSIKTFAPGSDVFALDMGIRGRAKKINIAGSLGGNSNIFTEGDQGRIDNLTIAGNLIGSVRSSKSIRTIKIGGDFTGNVRINSGGTALKSLKVGGTFIAGSLEMTGNVGTIQTAGSLGSLGDTLNVNGNVSKILVGGDLRSNVRVTGNLKTLDVKGSIVDGGIEDGLVIDVSQTLNTLKVGGDIQPGVQINARAIRKQQIGGQNLGEITVVA